MTALHATPNTNALLNVDRIEGTPYCRVTDGFLGWYALRSDVAPLLAGADPAAHEHRAFHLQDLPAYVVREAKEQGLDRVNDRF